MLFNSVEFFIFFPLFIILYFITVRFIKKNWFTQLLLLSASLFFYMCWNPAYIVLILTSVCITWASGLLMEGRTLVVKRIILLLSLTSNLGILFFFKYYNFFTGTVERIAELLNLTFSAPSFNVLLPVGISFYTFQALGYSIDVYKNKVPSEKNFITYALFVTFFPQLVAGPIERTGHLLPQFKINHEFDRSRVTEGLKLMVWGLFKKVTADRLADFINPVYDISHSPAYTLLIAMFLFSFQILCDFSGYSDIAIGTARILGFDLMTNFRRPYFAKSIADFWRRWHISLSTWFKDYVYFPLGGSRVPKLRHFFNLMVTFLVSGLWHGASLNFIVWGGLHGLFQITGHITGPARKKIRDFLGINEYSFPYALLQRISTFLLVTFAWIFFRTTSFSQSIRLLKRLREAPAQIVRGIQILFSDGLSVFVNGFASDLPNGYRPLQLLLISMNVAILILADFLQRRKPGVTRVTSWKPYVRYPLYVLISLAVLLLGLFGRDQFIYFQF